MPATRSRRSILWSLNYAMEGIVWALRTQRNMRIHIAAATAVAVVSLLLGISRMQLVAVVFSISLVIVTELVNTAIEAAVDIATEHFDPLAKTSKDVAAAAVLVASINALVVAYLVLFNPFKEVVQHGLDIVALSGTDLTVVALGIVLIAVIVLKAVSREGTWMSGGWPSGHAAVAFGLGTVLGFTTMNAGALLIAYFIAALVVQSRLEAQIHTLAQSIVGALLGISLVTLVFQLFFR
ncbi:MAG: phosphatase PAP2 family protein [Actinobacteria bacterium]|nr:MAG: phosphatase PAP2 family protein [Actinomycetota bacterium]